MKEPEKCQDTSGPACLMVHTGSAAQWGSTILALSTVCPFHVQEISHMKNDETCLFCSLVHEEFL